MIANRAAALSPAEESDLRIAGRQELTELAFDSVLAMPNGDVEAEAMLEETPGLFSELGLTASRRIQKRIATIRAERAALGKPIVVDGRLVTPQGEVLLEARESPPSDFVQTTRALGISDTDAAELFKKSKTKSQVSITQPPAPAKGFKNVS